MTPDELMIAAKAAGLDGICLTEHNRIWTESEAKTLSDKHGLAVFRGMEVTTTGGDILVFGLNEEPGDQLWTPADLKAKVDAVGGVAIVAHPFRGFLVFGFGALNMSLEDAIENPTFLHAHGLEICNSMATTEENDMARQVAEELGHLMVGGSDAHRPQAVGSCVTVFEDTIQTEKDLVSALFSRRYSVARRR